MFIQLLVNGLISGVLYAVLAMSFALIYNTTKTFHVAHAAIYTLAAYYCYSLLALLRWPLWLSIFAALLLAAISGVVIELCVYAPLSRKGSSALVGLLSSLGVYAATINTIALVFGNGVKTLRNSVEITYVLGSVIVTRMQLVQFAVASVILSLMILFLSHTGGGRVIRALRDNSTLASVLGINVDSVRLVIFAIASALAGLAAILSALDVGIEPQVGMPALLTAIAAMIVGGVGTFGGPVLGSIILGLLQSMAVWALSSRWADALTFAVFVLFLLLRPTGVVGRKRRLEEEVVA